MRTSSVVTISLPPSLLAISDDLAKSQHMNRSEFLRDLLRDAIAEASHAEAIAVWKKEKEAGTLMTLEGSLADLID